MCLLRPRRGQRGSSDKRTQLLSSKFVIADISHCADPPQTPESQVKLFQLDDDDSAIEGSEKISTSENSLIILPLFNCYWFFELILQKHSVLDSGK